MNQAQARSRIEELGLTRESFLDQMQSRQEMFMGRENCRKLRDSVVAVAGFGGGGGLALELMARAGVGRFRLLDMDAYDISNLNRQLLATVETLGRPKAEVAAERVIQINPYADVEMVFNEAAGADSIDRMMNGADLGLVCTDSPSSQRFFQQSAMKYEVPLICGWCSPRGAGSWVLDYKAKRRKWSLKNLPLVRRFFRSRMGAQFERLSEEQILALDANFHADGAPASVGYTANFSSCLLAATAVKRLTGRDCRPHKVNFNFETMKQN